MQLNITTLIASQNHEQHYGIEHIAVQTGDCALLYGVSGKHHVAAVLR